MMGDAMVVDGGCVLDEKWGHELICGGMRTKARMAFVSAVSVSVLTNSWQQGAKI